MKQPSEHQLDENSDEIPEMRKGDDSTNRQDAIQNNPCDSDVTTHVGDDDENDADLHDNGLVRYRCVRSVVDSWPRTTAVVCRIILPLWLLIGITLGFGHLLGQYEEQNEYYQNDEIAKERFLLQQLPINKTLEAIYNMPEACIDTYTDFKDEDNNSTNSEGFLAAYVQHNKLKIVFPNVTPGLADLSVAETLQEVREFMSICSAISTFLGGDCFDYIRTEVTANVFEEMTFTGFDVGTPPCGMNPFLASEAQIVAANNQSYFYMSAWQQDQHKLFRQYLGECSIEDDLTCEKDAFERSVDGATGSGICSVNTGGSAWFWFTVMSTVGYGNQAPVTAQGRSLVSGLSWLCTALFGGISLVAGGVIATLSDDLFRRYHLAVLTKHSASVAFWAAATVLWLVIQATIGYAWWKDRSPEVTFTRYDSLWWSYISLTTVGLGDYFLEPETMFTVDVFLWSLLFFIGFVTVTTFLNKVTSWLGSFYTHTTSNLKERMARSDPLSGRVSDYKKTNKEALHDINALVDMMGSIKGHDNIGMTLKKRKILIRLLAQTEHELEDFSTLGGVSPSIRKEDTAALKKEEDILSEILSRIRLEQRLMQESSRSKVDTDSERLSNYSGGAVGHVDVRSGAQ